ncbi:hypothetical protein SAMN06295998_11286 [Primorskyibacter flagellatus]|uniref:Uncharacterized protein n=1 Tax=Primorskyibacter flagellatus TaxID=1387277 RepID=A0A1W2DBQ7_9RHOB|nr:hypothetical protein SAMN06295998_11286 [Primorskyibacter flagellatus]
MRPDAGRKRQLAQQRALSIFKTFAEKPVPVRHIAAGAHMKRQKPPTGGRATGPRALRRLMA